MGSETGEKKGTHDPLKRYVYLLIAWQERPASSVERAIWRFSLENARTGQRHGFGTLEQLLTFLEDCTTGRIISNRIETISQGKGETDEHPTP